MALGRVDGLFDSDGDLLGLAQTESDTSLTIADDDCRSETELATAARHLRDAADLEEDFFEFFFDLFES